LLAAAACLVLACRPSDDGTPAAVGPTSDADRFQGTWELQAVWRDGRERPPDDGERGTTITFRGDRQINRRPGAPVVEGIYRLDPARDPQTIDVDFVEGPSKGLGAPLAVYRLDGDVLELCMSEAVARPQRFPERPEPGLVVYVLRRVRP
jgi:uncharacterized protein (TIGR03067 family)